MIRYKVNKILVNALYAEKKIIKLHFEESAYRQGVLNYTINLRPYHSTFNRFNAIRSKFYGYKQEHRCENR